MIYRNSANVGVSSSQLTGYEQRVNKNAATGYAGLDASGNLSAILIPRHDTAANLNLVVLASGEFASATDTKELRLGDGVTSGGLVYSGVIPNKLLFNGNVYTNIPPNYADLSSMTSGFIKFSNPTYGNILFTSAFNDDGDAYFFMSILTSGFGETDAFGQPLTVRLYEDGSSVLVLGSPVQFNGVGATVDTPPTPSLATSFTGRFGGSTLLGEADRWLHIMIGDEHYRIPAYGPFVP